MTEVISSAAKPEVVITNVVMEDGRTVEFSGKTVLKKEIITDAAAGTVAVRFDFITGQTITAQVPAQHLLYAAGHGYSQKLGDEVAGMKNEDKSPASPEDKFLAIESLHQRLQEGDWNKAAEGGGGVSGAGIVLRAIMEVSGKSLSEAKAFIEKKLAQAAEAGRKLTRQALYASFRNPESKTGKVIERLERAKKAAAVVEDSDKMMEELND